MRYNSRSEIIILSITTPILIISLISIITLFFFYFQRMKYAKKYQIFIDKIDLIESNLLFRGIHRLDIISKRNPIYRGKYKEFETQFEILKNRIEALQNFNWSWNMTNIISKKTKDIKKILNSYSNEVNDIYNSKNKIESQLHKLLQSDKYLDEEMSYLKHQYKIILQKYESEKVEFSSVKQNLNNLLSRIKAAFSDFEVNYKKVNWQKCSDKIEELRGLLIEFAVLMNKSYTINFYINKWIPNLLIDLNKKWNEVKKNDSNRWQSLDYENKLVKINKSIHQIKTIFQDDNINVTQLEAKIKDTIYIIKELTQRLQHEFTSFNFITQFSKPFIEEMKMIYNELIKSKNEIITLSHSSKETYVLFRNKIYDEFRQYEIDINSFDTLIRKFESNLKNKEILYFDLVKSIRFIMKFVELTIENEKKMFILINYYINSISLINITCENIKFYFEKAIKIFNTKNISILEFASDIKEINNSVKLLQKKIKLNSIIHIDSWIDNLNEIRSKFATTWRKIERTIFIFYLSDYLFELPQVQKTIINDQLGENIVIKRSFTFINQMIESLAG